MPQYWNWHTSGHVNVDEIRFRLSFRFLKDRPLPFSSEATCSPTGSSKAGSVVSDIFSVCSDIFVGFGKMQSWPSPLALIKFQRSNSKRYGMSFKNRNRNKNQCDQIFFLKNRQQFLKNRQFYRHCSKIGQNVNFWLQNLKPKNS